MKSDKGSLDIYFGLVFNGDWLKKCEWTRLKIHALQVFVIKLKLKQIVRFLFFEVSKKYLYKIFKTAKFNRSSWFRSLRSKRLGFETLMFKVSTFWPLFEVFKSESPLL